ncbi:hypothetical protein AVEN_90850-1 [Araneus ventricosus]|uniref:Uncharacterized protein n=1 Tax=Araneus ventricosus TaxID=182803 RepID=A0A4Y2LE36_ARAVE|nr:hypothetical protein AVEN_90850-1 [Araneus ventricosus]
MKLRNSWINNSLPSKEKKLPHSANLFVDLTSTVIEEHGSPRDYDLKSTESPLSPHSSHMLTIQIWGSPSLAPISPHHPLPSSFVV